MTNIFSHMCNFVPERKLDEDCDYGKCSICHKEGITIKVYRRTILCFETGLKKNHCLEVQFFNSDSDEKVKLKYFVLNSGIPIQPISLTKDVVIIVDSDLTMQTAQYQLQHAPYNRCIYIQSINGTKTLPY